MHISGKGQVTIPIEIPEKAGLMPRMGIEFHIQSRWLRQYPDIRKSGGSVAKDRSLRIKMRTLVDSNIILDLPGYPLT